MGPEPKRNHRLDAAAIGAEIDQSQEVAIEFLNAAREEHLVDIMDRAKAMATQKEDLSARWIGLFAMLAIMRTSQIMSERAADVEGS